MAQSQSAKIFADAWKTKDLYDLQYVTAADERVRKDHKAWNGITRPVDDGFWNKYLPPNGWRCRCKVRKVAKGTPNTPVEKLKGLPKPEKGFAYNSGAKKMIFDENSHPYFADFDENNLTAVNHYGMRTVENIYKKTENLSARNSEWTQEQFKTEWEKLSKEANLKDNPNSFILETVLKDKLLFDNDLFEKITGKKATEARWALASNLKDIVTNPDEVWSGYNKTSNYDGYILTYIKYYQDKMIVVVCNLGGDEVIKVSSFYEVKRTSIDALRKGILMHRK